jgi:hypothetical protein
MDTLNHYHLGQATFINCNQPKLLSIRELAFKIISEISHDQRILPYSIKGYVIFKVHACYFNLTYF